MRRKLVLLLTLLVAAAAILQPGMADAAKKRKLPLQTVACGEVITRSIRVNNDLNCTGDGLIIGAKIVLDLNGHTISGDGGDIGVFNPSGGSAFATIRNGTLRKFDVGIATGQPNTRIVGINATGNSGHGIFLAPQATASSVRKSVSSGNSGNGITVTADNVVVSLNTTTGNANGIYFTSAATGMTASGNKANGNSENGILVSGENGTIASNDVAGNGDAANTPGLKLDVDSNDNVVTKNRITGSGNDGYQDLGTNNTATNNRAIGNGFSGTPNGIGTGIDASGATTPHGSGNVSRGNDASDQCVPDPLCE